MEGVASKWNSFEIRSGIASFKMCRLSFDYYSLISGFIK